jgi:hypothetical protein
MAAGAVWLRRGEGVARAERDVAGQGRPRAACIATREVSLVSGGHLGGAHGDGLEEVHGHPTVHRQQGRGRPGESVVSGRRNT